MSKTANITNITFCYQIDRTDRSTSCPYTHLPRRPHWGDQYEFGVWSDIAEVITRAKVCVYWFRGFGDLTPQIFLFFIMLIWSPLFNGASTTMLQCDNRGMISDS